MKLLAIATLAVATAAPAQVVNTILNNGSTATHYDIVILGDGYRAAEQTKFNNDCARFLADMLRKEPYQTYGAYFNVHTVFRASNQSGADHPDASPPIVRDTVYDASYNTGGTPRCLYIGNTSQALADAALAPATEGRVLVFVNDTRYGGCGGQFAVSYTGSLMSEVQLHEMGHSIGGLADEYVSSSGCAPGGEPSQVNVTRSSNGAKWSHWIGTDGISAFQGARYWSQCMYRPRVDCLMRSLNQPNCRVCAEALVLTAHRFATAIQSPQPSAGTVSIVRPARQTFSFTSIAPASSNATITWELDGTVVATGTTSYVLDSNAHGVGSHTLIARVVDNTSWVRSDPSRLLDQERRWSVTIGGTPQPDLENIGLQLSAATVQAGTTVDIWTYTGNFGNLAAGAHRVDHFLSTDATITTAGTYLGGFDNAALTPLQFRPFSRSAVRVPAHVQPGSYWLGAFIDSTDVVAESDETDNIRTVPVTITRAGCTPALEFVDPLVWPTDSAAVGANAADTVHPTVVAPCNAGAPYIIVWGRSGTSPGTPLGGGLVLPLNLDVYTDLSLLLQNTPIFASFFGTLDANGLGRASFSMAGVNVQRDLPGHFAAAILTPSLSAFAGVTNPVMILVRP